MKNIAKIHDVVLKVLDEMPYTRGSDNFLYIEVCKRFNPDVSMMGFEFVLNNVKDLGIPCYESVRRSRQKAQENDESLKPTQSVTDERYEAFKVVREYANVY